MRGFGDGQMEADIRLRGDIRIFTLGRFKAQTNFFFIGVGGPHRCVPRGAGLDGVAGFEDVEAVVRVIGQQRLQRLDDVLLRPRFMLPADEGAAATTAQQHAFIDQHRQRFAQGIARDAELGGELAFSGQSHARLQLLFFNQRPDATRHVVGQAFRHHYHGIIQVKT